MAWEPHDYAESMRDAGRGHLVAADVDWWEVAQSIATYDPVTEAAREESEPYRHDED